MLNLTVEQVFGKGATQNSTTVIIQKSSLPGLTPKANNKATGLLVALLLQANQQFEGNLSDSQGIVVTDQNNHPLTYNNRELYEKLNLWFWKKQYLRNYVLNTFILDVFIKPPTELDTRFQADFLNY